MARIKSINKRSGKDEALYNLAVEEDESYIANGIVVHNCRSILVPITKFRVEAMREEVKDGDLKSELKKPIDFYNGFRTGATS